MYLPVKDDLSDQSLPSRSANVEESDGAGVVGFALLH